MDGFGTDLALSPSQRTRNKGYWPYVSREFSHCQPSDVPSCAAHGAEPDRNDSGVVYLVPADKPVVAAEVLVAGAPHQTDASGSVTATVTPGCSRARGREGRLRRGDRVGSGRRRFTAGRRGGFAASAHRRRDGDGLEHSHRQAARGPADAGRGRAGGRGPGEADDDAGRRLDAAQRDKRAARADHLSLARRRQCAYPGPSRPYTQILATGPAAVRRTDRVDSGCLQIPPMDWGKWR